MSYEGRNVRHFEYGVGTVIRVSNNKAFVVFSEKENYAGNQYCFIVPDAFQKGYLELLNVDGEENIDSVNSSMSTPNMYRDLYKKPFWDYLNEEKIKRTGEPYKMDTIAVDAFYLEKHSVDRDFLDWMRSDDSMEEAKNELTRIIEKAGGPRTKPRIDAYYNALSKLRDYLIQRGVI